MLARVQLRPFRPNPGPPANRHDHYSFCGRQRHRCHGPIIAQTLQEAFGRPFVVENKAGAGGLIAAQAVARATPDGYTLL